MLLANLGVRAVSMHPDLKHKLFPKSKGSTPFQKQQDKLIRDTAEESSVTVLVSN